MKPGFTSTLEIPFSVMTKDLSFRLWVMAISLSVVASLTAKTAFPTCLLHPVGPVTRSSLAICPLHPLLMRVVVLFILSIFDLLSVSVDRLWKNWMKCHSLTRDFRTRQHLLYQNTIIFWKHKPDEHWRDEQARTYNRQPHRDKSNFDHTFGIPKFINAFVLVFFKKVWSLFLALFLYNSFVFDGLRSVTWRVMRTFTVFMLLNWTAEWQDSPFDPFSRS